MITNITLKNVASFGEHESGLKDLQLINFIYGANGVGKTTISNLLKNPNSDVFSDCSFEWKDGQSQDILVYNKSFRENNFGGDEIDGVFTLGQATKENLANIDDLRAKITTSEDDLLGFKKSIQTIRDKQETNKNQTRDLCWPMYKKHSRNFDQAFVGFKRKDPFFEKLILESKNIVDNTIEFTDLLERARLLFERKPEKEPLIEIPYLAIEALEIELNSLWQKIIVGKKDIGIGDLIGRLQMSDWVFQGVRFIQTEDATCPFCQNETITQDLRSQFDDYFDETFLRDTKELSSLQEDYSTFFDNIVISFEQVLNEQKSSSKSKLDIDTYTSKLDVLKANINSNKEKIAEKLKEPSRKIELTSNKQVIDEITKSLSIANENIQKNNELVDNYHSEYSRLISDVWKYIGSENKVILDNYLSRVDGFKTGINNLELKITKKQEDIRNLKDLLREDSENITSVQPSIDAINSTLKAFGFTSFKIVTSGQNENKYQIQRENGDLVRETLSEGEITFITFLYYYQLAIGGSTFDTVINDRILVIDDPISSLDSNILFVISTLIKELLREARIGGAIKQVIVLTHNVYFHKEVSYIDGNPRRDAHFWIIRKKEDTSSIQSFGMSNPISNSYELLWSELRNSDKLSRISIQNTMRRIIENYFKILGRYGDDKLIDSFHDFESKAICRSLLSWVNEGSHTVPDDLFIEDAEDIIERYRGVFKAIFEKTNHIEHYRMMMRSDEEDSLNERIIQTTG
ncbi:MAG: AAA family ATPase [Bacteroidetes bacterium]|nr:AAA family ATPase [Bacteroidota bacterium]